MFTEQRRTISRRDVLKYLLYAVIIGVLIYILYNLVFKEYFTDSYEKYYDPKIEQLQQKIGEVIPEIKDVEISGGTKSLTINKKVVYICAKDANGNYYGDNMLTYVILHELAHVLCDEVGHTEKFKSIFKKLLDKATDGGIYDPSIPPIDNYCNY